MTRSRTLLPAALLLGALLSGCASSTPGDTGSGEPFQPLRPAPSGTASSETTTGGAARATGLDPGLVAAFAQARAAAQDAGHVLVINSGYRTPERQQQLLDEEVAKRGSLEAASRWVSTPERSMHVRGLAIDVGDGPAADWLAQEGPRWGICHTLSWEWWHFEWRARWQRDRSCPKPADDPSEAPGP